MPSGMCLNWLIYSQNTGKPKEDISPHNVTEDVMSLIQAGTNITMCVFFYLLSTRYECLTFSPVYIGKVPIRILRTEGTTYTR